MVFPTINCEINRIIQNRPPQHLSDPESGSLFQIQRLTRTSPARQWCAEQLFGKMEPEHLFPRTLTGMHQDTHTYTGIFVENTPLIDVRAPVEFERGAFPTSKNLPILDNCQREAVGICYKQHGKQRAILKGRDLVRREVRESRTAAWLEFARRNPNGALYCFRGGLRSQIARQWMHEAGADFPVVPGGYKALRTFLLAELEDAVRRCTLTLVGGKTGCGKTLLVGSLAHGIDLEAAACHRGSSFGRHAKEQNTQINFENRLAIDFLKLKHAQVRSIVLEDEARTIGKVAIPKSLFEKMRQSAIVVVEEPHEARLERLIGEYVVDMQREFKDLDPENDGFDAFSAYLLNSLDRIRKRLGPARYPGIRDSMQQALELQSRTGELRKHYDWLASVLDNYYDPMYEDQLRQRRDFICFRGNYDACREYLAHASQGHAGACTTRPN